MSQRARDRQWPTRTRSLTVDLTGDGEPRKLREEREERGEWSERQLASAASHQLRGPLTVMRGILETLARFPDLDAETRSDLIGRALAAEARQEMLIETLLDGEDGRGHRRRTRNGDADDHAGPQSARPAGRFLPRDVELRRAVERVVKESLTPEEQWRVVVDVPDGTHAHVDPVALDCIVSNLVSNAVAYSPAGSPVEVRAARKGREIVVAVEDDGPGVAPEDRDRIFEPYERSSQVAGVGLGLAIARWAVDASGGRIWVESQPGSGARFCFNLPVARGR